MSGLSEKYEKYVVRKEPIPKYDPDVRQEVLDSWRRLSDADITRETVDRHVSPGTLEKILEENARMLRIGHSYLQNLYQYMDDATVLLSMEDKNGVVIDYMGANRTLEDITTDTNMFVGCLRSEDTAGTNGIGMALRLGKPIQISGKEHYCEVFHDYIGTAAPIRDGNNRIIGTIGSVTPLRGERQKLLLAMISSIADAIGNEFAMQTAYEHTEQIKDQLSTTIEAMPTGVIVLDKDNRVSMRNDLARKQLGVKGDIIGEHVDQFIVPKRGLKKVSDVTKDIHQVEHAIYENNVMVKNLSVSVAQMNAGGMAKEGKIVILEDIKRVHSLVGRLSGYRANYTFESIVGESAQLMRAKEVAKATADSSSNVLVLGESGTGKELFAQAIHNASKRANEPFIAVNCSSIPRELIESELFGYAPGAFTGASRNGQPGKFELANGGTIFLDEIGDMPLNLQTSLLRVLQTRTITRLGDSVERPIDVRVITATNVNLMEEVRNSNFRGDLYYRLNVISIDIPPLRERNDDIPLLARYFVQEKNARLGKLVDEITPKAMERLKSYNWPGNVRELENVIERAINLTNTSVIDEDDLPPQLLGEVLKSALEPLASVGALRKESVTKETSQERFVRELEESLRRNNGNVTRVAEEIGISKRTLYRKIEKYGVKLDDFRY